LRRHPAVWAVALVVGLVAWGCGGGKGSAEKALAEAEAAYAKIAVEARHVAPDEATHVEDGIASAKSQLAAHDYNAVLGAVPGIKASIAALEESLPGKREKLQAQWDELTRTVPNALASLDRKLRNFGRPPAGMAGRAEFDQATSRLGDLRQRWADAQELAKQEALAKAVAAADEVRLDAVKVFTEFGQSGS
jgi:hypothetical protein